MAKDEQANDGYMSVGELAKRMDTTVRTLQYYDKQGILIPSGESAGGRRLYSDADMVQLHQIQMLKSLGFSLDDIRERITTLETPIEVAQALEQQAASISAQIEGLREALHSVQTLREETLKMDKVDFARYADIVELLNRNTGLYWVVAMVGDKMLERMRALGLTGRVTADAVNHDWHQLNLIAAKYAIEGIAPDSAQGMAFAAKYWEMVTNFSGGDLSLLSEMQDFAKTSGSWTPEFRGAWDVAEPFISEALSAYFEGTGNPFEQTQS
ncbi:MAG: MerR family transcriptional regulator [Promicromonosporaceae bacterium]|nr:MerR family transcriptional regulator [Promicromonosporaceae bacterium]